MKCICSFSLDLSGTLLRVCSGLDWSFHFQVRLLLCCLISGTIGLDSSWLARAHKKLLKLAANGGTCIYYRGLPVAGAYAWSRFVSVSCDLRARPGYSENARLRVNPLGTTHRNSLRDALAYGSVMSLVGNSTAEYNSLPLCLQS